MDLDKTTESPPEYAVAVDLDTVDLEAKPIKDTSEAPPAYDSLFGKVRGNRKVSSFTKVVQFCCSSIGCTIGIGVCIAIPISMIVIGSMYLGKCTIERFIPIYLIVGGCFGVFKNVSSIVQNIVNKKKGRESENAKPTPWDGIVTCFLFAWFIAGNVWIYRVHTHVNFDDASSPMYCPRTVYLYAFWLTTSTYIFLILGCCCLSITACVTMCCK